MIDKQTMQIPGWRGGDGDAAYLDKTLRHHAVEISLDESVNWRTIFQLGAHAFIVSVPVWLGFAFLAILVAMLSDSPLGTFSSTVTILGIGTVISSIVFWIILLFSKLTEPIAEWRVLLHDRMDKAEFVYSQISGTLARRQIPIGGSCRRIRTGMGPQDISNRLVLIDGNYVAYVSVFGYGTSLYLGWVMWRTRRGTTLIKQFIGDIVGAMFGWNDPELLMLRTDRPRAMREALHSACREGLFVAIEGVDVPGQYGFPNGMPPIENGNNTYAAPVPQAPEFNAPQRNAPQFNAPQFNAPQFNSADSTTSQQPQSWRQSPPGHPNRAPDSGPPQQQ